MSTSNLLDRLWGAGNLDAAFGQASRVVAPWPRAARLRHGPDARTLYTQQILESPVYLSEVDPRRLFASQTWVVRHHADYYLTGEWEVTGITSADRDSDANRFPIIVTDIRGRMIISTGHHRALAALIEGRPLLCRRSPDMNDGAVALLPRLLFGPWTRLDHVECETADAAVEAVRSGHTALCTDFEVTKATALTLSPSLAQRHIDAIEPPPIEPPIVVEQIPGENVLGLCTTCGGLKQNLLATIERYGHRDYCYCEPRPEGLTSEQSESRMPCMLCEVCGLEVLHGHWRMRFVICEECRPRAHALNARVGRKVLLQGIHSIVNGGPLLSLAEIPTEDDFVGFAGQLNEMASSIDALSDWSEQRMLQRLRTLGFEAGQVIALDEYLNACAAAGIDRDFGWREIEAHLLAPRTDAVE